MTDFKSSVNDYLESLPPVTLLKLYTSPATCLAIFRLLPAMARMVVMSMLFNETPVPLDHLSIWVNADQPGSRQFQAEALRKMKGLHIVGEVRVGEGMGVMCMSLDSEFRRSFKAALTGEVVENISPNNNNNNEEINGGNFVEDVEGDNSFGVPLNTPDKHQVDIKFLDEHATRQWELILHFMVGTPVSQMPNPGVLSLLQHAKLMETTPGDGVMRITNAGFQFLLQDVNAQIWTLLLQYLSMSEGLNMNTVDVLNFIFMLGSLELGRDYSLAALSDTQLTMLEDLRDFGLVYQRKRSSRRFYPTRLATTLTSDASSLRTPSKAMEIATEKKDKDDNGNNKLSTGLTASNTMATSTASKFIILETNYRLYAYTDSPLQIAVLNLFVGLKTRFANMVTGQITRDSVRFALSNGITAAQILTYLTVHAHPQMYKNDKGVLPPTVVDQIKLWQLEMDRVNAMPGYLYTDFRHNDEYAMVVGYARELGVLLWHNDSKMKCFVSREGNAQVVEFVNRRNRR